MKNKTSKNHETPPLQQGAVMGSADVMTFGKHKGKRIEDVARTDRSYLEWLLNEKKKDPHCFKTWNPEMWLKGPLKILPNMGLLLI